MIGDDRLSQRQAAIIGRDLAVEINDEPLLIQPMTDQLKQDTVLPHPSGQGNIMQAC